MPRQARAEATVDAIFEATIQLLTRAGADSLTTTRVAERAGVSVGTLYQYFPNKQALIYALNERYLEALAKRIEATCSAQAGQTAPNMLKTLIDTYWQAKTERPEVTRALYRSVADLDNSALIETFARRVDTATTAMFASACDADFADLASVNLTLVTVIFGTVRNAFERGLDSGDAEKLQGQLHLMCDAYLKALDRSSIAQTL
ncbi:TetR/AcrR family transcriptional regulator [Martelella radicis]|uniref:AcrR family transcriptional regulator n=1 Tax=Martelella radicis TaxID=1397476 RepID=A0A7W6KNI7_9HYPH|nr:TetR/AcrR family transcriptional regulator [Martelella radicis]MBB4124502.1 AcrR family transcriptional regulator [Martelella radicis]